MTLICLYEKSKHDLIRKWNFKNFNILIDSWFHVVKILRAVFRKDWVQKYNVESKTKCLTFDFDHLVLEKKHVQLHWQIAKWKDWPIGMNRTAERVKNTNLKILKSFAVFSCCICSDTTIAIVKSITHGSPKYWVGILCESFVLKMKCCHVMLYIVRDEQQHEQRKQQ